MPKANQRCFVIRRNAYAAEAYRNHFMGLRQNASKGLHSIYAIYEHNMGIIWARYINGHLLQNIEEIDEPGVRLSGSLSGSLLVKACVNNLSLLK